MLATAQLVHLLVPVVLVVPIQVVAGAVALLVQVAVLLTGPWISRLGA